MQRSGCKHDIDEAKDVIEGVNNQMLYESKKGRVLSLDENY